MANGAVLNVRIPSSLAEQMAERQKNTFELTSSFVRRTVAAVLAAEQKKAEK